MEQGNPVDDQNTNPRGNGDDNKTVSYETHRKLLDEKKKAAEELKALKERLDAIENEKLASEGKSKELADKYRKELEDERLKGQQAKQRIVKDRVENSLKLEATKAGLNMPFERFAKLVDLDTIEVDADTLEVNSRDIQRVLEKAREDMPYLFGKTKVDVNNIDPSKSQATLQSPKDLSELSEKQIKEMLKQHYK